MVFTKNWIVYIFILNMTNKIILVGWHKQSHVYAHRVEFGWFLFSGEKNTYRKIKRVLLSLLRHNLFIILFIFLLLILFFKPLSPLPPNSIFFYRYGHGNVTFINYKLKCPHKVNIFRNVLRKIDRLFFLFFCTYKLIRTSLYNYWIFIPILTWLSSPIREIVCI